MKKIIKSLIKSVIIIILILSFNSYALTVNNYNRFCEDGKLLNVEIKFNDVVAKYNKYGHYKLGDDYMPTGNIEDPLSNEGDRDIAHTAVQSDTTYKIYGELDEEEMDYSYYDYEDLTASDIKVYELQAKLEALKIGNQVQERSGYGKYNLRNGKNLIAFIKFAYEFYRNSGEYRVGIKDDKLFKDTPAAGYPVCPIELLEEYATLNSTSAVELNNGFEDKFKDCVSKWEYIGNKELENQDKIFETLEDIYMGLVYLYPALKVLQNKGGMNLDDLDENDRAAIFSMAYEVKGMQPITSANLSDEQLTRKFSRIGAGDLIGALIQDEELNFSVAETVYRYMIEIKHKNNPVNLARWISEFEDVLGTYDPLDAETLDKFIKAYNVAFAKYGSDVSRQTGLDYVFFGYVEHPELFESKNSLREMTERFANHLRAYFSDSAFIRNKDNANYVAKSYMMAQKMCENTGFLDITDIYASDICLVEHSYGYNSTEYILSDTQVVSLEGTLEEGDFDTDKDEVLDRDEIGIEEEVNISRLLEAYIKYNELPQEEADKLRATPTVKMYNYISNPVLPDSDFDGRDDLRDRARALDNSYKMTMDTDVVEDAKYDLNVDYRYFFMDNTKYYPELSDMAVTLANMVTRKGWQNKNWNNKTENLNGSDIESFMWHYGNEDIEVHDMSNYYSDANVCRYAIGQHDVILRRGKVNHKVRNVITVAIGEIPEKTAELTANLYGLLGSDEEYKEYHHIGYDITASRIFENVLRFTENYNNNQKVFFITGARSAGGVANLLSKKLIDKFGQSSVYGYTFNAVSTINGNMIPEGQKLPNLKYAPIMNIYNDDEMMVMFTSEETNMYKYGTNVHMSLSDNYSGKVKIAFNKVHPKGYSKNMKSKVVDLLNRTFNINLSGYTPSIFGFTGTELTDEEMEDYMKISNDYSAGKLHYVFGENDIEKITATWDKVYSMCIENNMSSLVITHAETMFNQYSNELQRIHNIPKDIGKESLSKNIDYVAQTSGINNSGVSGHTQPSIPPSSNKNSAKSYDNILTCVEQLAKLYINHVGTYRTILQTTSNSESNHSCTNRAYEYLKNNGVTIDEYKDNKKGYKVIAPSSNSSNIYVADGWLHYVYDENSDENTSPLISNWHVRDDCSGFVKSVIKLAGKEFTGFNTDLINGYDKSLAPNLSRAGYDLYQYANGVWSKISFSSLEFSSIKTELALPVGDSMDIDFLKPGDILVTNSHAEIYVGNNYNKVLGSITNKNDRNIAKKSHIWTNADVTHTDAMPVKIAKGTDVVGLPTYVREGTFAWGSVIDEFPTETKDGNRHYFYYDSGANCFRHCECGKDPNDSAEEHKSSGCLYGERQYTVIWRKR